MASCNRSTPGIEDLIDQPRMGEPFSVELGPGAYRYEWFDPIKAVVVEDGPFEAPGRAVVQPALKDGRRAVSQEARLSPGLP
jgi:hypothetical protein